jgi:hypothetical protein
MALHAVENPMKPSVLLVVLAIALAVGFVGAVPADAG